jgi:long-chain fatty acid transport protein
VEYVFGDFAVRGGYYYDPTPTPDETLTILIPGFDFNNITFGFGYHKDGFGLDFGFEYLMGKDRNIALDEANSMPGLYEMYILVPQVSITYGW